MAIGDLGATDIFLIGTTNGWHAQSSTKTASEDIVEVLDGTGSVSCLTPFGEENVATAEYELCGTAGVINLELGAVKGGYILRNVEFSHEAGQAPRMSVEGIAYDGNETLGDNTYTINKTAISNLDIDTNKENVSGVGDATSITQRWEIELVTQPGGDGQIAYVTPRTPMETYEESGSGATSGVPAIATPLGYVLESFEDSDSNQELDTYSVSFKRGLESSLSAAP